MRSIVAVLALALVAIVQPAGRALAQGLIRDTEIETNLRSIADPLFGAAGLAPGAVDVYLVGNAALNAFVAGGQNLFINSGLVIRAVTPEQLAGVIAHETGHIAGGHLSRAANAMDRAGAEMIIGALLGLAAALAGAPQVGLAALAGGATVAQRGLLAFSRGQEQAADQAAITYLADVRLSPEGLLQFFEILESSNYRINREGDVFLRSHPLTRDRIGFLEQQAASSPYRGRKLEPSIQEGFRRSQAKLEAFLVPPATTLAKYKGDGIVDRYARAIAHFREPELSTALAEIRELIASEPDNPFFHELEGQVLFENGRIADSIGPYRTAARLAPRAGMIAFGLARALLEQPGEASHIEAAGLFREVTALEPQNAQAWRFLGVAEGKIGNQGASALALTEAAVLRRNRQDARLYLGRAQQTIKPGDPDWVRLEDLRRAVDDLRERERS